MSSIDDLYDLLNPQRALAALHEQRVHDRFEAWIKAADIHGLQAVYFAVLAGNIDKERWLLENPLLDDDARVRTSSSSLLPYRKTRTDDTTHNR
jgi:hypothetical protein